MRPGIKGTEPNHRLVGLRISSKKYSARTDLCSSLVCEEEKRVFFPLEENHQPSRSWPVSQCTKIYLGIRTRKSSDRSINRIESILQRWRAIFHSTGAISGHARGGIPFNVGRHRPTNYTYARERERGREENPLGTRSSRYLFRDARASTILPRLMVMTLVILSDSMAWGHGSKGNVSEA